VNSSSVYCIVARGHSVSNSVALPLCLFRFQFLPTVVEFGDEVLGALQNAAACGEAGVIGARGFGLFFADRDASSAAKIRASISAYSYVLPYAVSAHQPLNT
jgi:hypothetical protein